MWGVPFLCQLPAQLLLPLRTQWEIVCQNLLERLPRIDGERVDAQTGVLLGEPVLRVCASGHTAAPLISTQEVGRALAFACRAGAFSRRNGSPQNVDEVCGVRTRAARNMPPVISTIVMSGLLAQPRF